MTWRDYFEDEFQFQKLYLYYPNPAVFYASIWQRSFCPIPLLIVRACLFGFIIAIIGISTHANVVGEIYNYWLIYLTHWGLTTILMATGAGLAVSIMGCLCYDTDDGGCPHVKSLPWYIQLFWLFYNIASPLAIFITIFYWTILYRNARGVNADFLVSFSAHALNSVIMLAMLLSSAVPSYLLHAYQPCLFGAAWAIFSIIYYLAGGLNPFGLTAIYPVVNWSLPGKTILVFLGAGVLIIIVHCIIVALATLRNYIACYIMSKRQDNEMCNEEGGVC